MEKPEECRICSGPLSQPATGRPRVYCGTPCRRAAEMAIRRLQQQLHFAEKRDLLAREAVAAAWDPDSRQPLRKVAKYWTGEIERLQKRLVQLLAGTGEEAAGPPPVAVGGEE